MNSFKSVMVLCSFESSLLLERNTGRRPLLDQNGELVSLMLTGAPENLAYAIMLKHSKSTEARPQSGLQMHISMIFQLLGIITE